MIVFITFLKERNVSGKKRIFRNADVLWRKGTAKETGGTNWRRKISRRSLIFASSGDEIYSLLAPEDFSSHTKDRKLSEKCYLGVYATFV